jgi:hypothetical protein
VDPILFSTLTVKAYDVSGHYYGTPQTVRGRAFFSRIKIRKPDKLDGSLQLVMPPLSQIKCFPFEPGKTTRNQHFLWF